MFRKAFSARYFGGIETSDEILAHVAETFFKSKNRADLKNAGKLVVNFRGNVGINQIKAAVKWAKENPRNCSSYDYFKTFYPNPDEMYEKKCSLSDSGSLESFVKRFGEEVGKIKYEEVRRKKIISLENFKKKYGEEEGERRWQHFCERNKGNHTLERKIEMRGEEEGKLYYEKCKENLKNKHSLENLIRLYGEERGKEIRRSLCKKHSEYAKNAPNAVWRVGTENYKKWREVMAKRRTERPPIDYGVARAWQKYQKEVGVYTSRQNIKSLKFYDLRGRADKCQLAYHLDHKISVKFGFTHRIPPEIIGSIENLQFIPVSDNCNKRDKCWSSLHSKDENINLNSDYFLFLEDFKYE